MLITILSELRETIDSDLERIVMRPVGKPL